MLLLGSKGGCISLLLVSEHSCTFLNWFNISDTHWITAIEVSSFVLEGNSDEFITNGKTLPPDGHFVALIGTSEGQITKRKMTLRGGVLACSEMGDINQNDKVPVNQISYSPDHALIAFSKGCNLYVHPIEGITKSIRMSTQLLSGFSWISDHQIAAVSLEGEMRIFDISDFIIQKSLPVVEPNWGAFGAASSPGSTHLASLVKYV